MEQAIVVQELLDREAIRNLIYRYARAVDRRDFAEVRHLYHPDATDDHGNYSGAIAGFFDYLETTDLYESMHHTCANILIELHGETADVETYFIFTAVLRPQPGSPDGSRMLDYLVGRFIDRFEKRDDTWRILRRVVVRDARHRQPLNDPGDRFHVGKWFPDDDVYGLRRAPAGESLSASSTN
jgi:ketosteroid isomerase-like protein